MGRVERRAWNKKHGIDLSDKEQFDAAIAYERIKSGNFNLSGLNLPKDFMHLDNEELAPEGAVCMLNYDRIKERLDKSPDSYEQWYKDVVENLKGKQLHLTREGASNSLVCVKEDDREIEVEGKMEKAPKALFDVYSDLLFEGEDGKWLMLAEIDPKLNGYKKIDTSVVKEIDEKIEQNSEKGEENNEKGEQNG